jgi:hypothetical protein
LHEPDVTAPDGPPGTVMSVISTSGAAIALA